MRKTAFTLLTAALVMSASPAFAQSEEPCIDGYSGEECEEAPNIEETAVVLGTKTVRGGVVGGATLPMTGAELTGLAIAGIALVGGGTTLVVSGRRRKHAPTA